MSIPPPRGRLTIVMSSLGPGGAERLISTLAASWLDRGWKITFLTYDDDLAPTFFPLPQAIKRRALGLFAVSRGSWLRGLRNNLRRIITLRRAVRATAPDIVLSLIDRTNVIVLMALFGMGYKVVVWENTDPEVARKSRYLANWGRRLSRVTYPLADAIVAQTDTAAAYLARQYGDKAVGIPNPVLQPPQVKPMPLKRPAVLGLGRLSAEKGFDLLIRAFAHLSAEFPEWYLYIFGEGPERKSLENLVVELGLTDRILLPGLTSEPAAILGAADLFVLSSHIEGFSLALCEALACGLPAVATDCSSGPRTVLRDEIDGILVPPDNVERLASAMSRLMESNELRMRFGARAREVIERFSLDSVLARWDALFEKLLSRSSRMH